LHNLGSLYFRFGGDFSGVSAGAMSFGSENCGVQNRFFF
jgi:hypothetical protein